MYQIKYSCELLICLWTIEIMDVDMKMAQLYVCDKNGNVAIVVIFNTSKSSSINETKYCNDYPLKWFTRSINDRELFDPLKIINVAMSYLNESIIHKYVKYVEINWIKCHIKLIFTFSKHEITPTMSRAIVSNQKIKYEEMDWGDACIRIYNTYKSYLESK